MATLYNVVKGIIVHWGLTVIDLQQQQKIPLSMDIFWWFRVNPIKISGGSLHQNRCKLC
jgi:hypothetical protein